MPPYLPGLHHVTAITADAQKNLDYYTGVLGLRLVKLTVNFDDPASYHLYYGDALGHPGTIITFFAWPGAQRGRIGPAQVTATAFAAPAASRDYWTDRLLSHGVSIDPAEARFGENPLRCADPDGLMIEIVPLSDIPATATPPPAPTRPEQALRGFHGVTLSEERRENTTGMLTGVMGFRAVGSEGNRFRYQAGGDDAFASLVDVVANPDAPRGAMGAGVVHHVAFRTPDDAQQLAWRQRLVDLEYNVSPVMDRTYFHSIYYREPGGVLFEIATTPPGFTTDEAPDHLGSRLMLPPWLESRRRQIELTLPPLRLPVRAVNDVR